jgi:hypothetical protein
MHAVEALEQAVELAKRAGFRVRQEWLGGAGGGLCEIQGRKYLFLDLALGPVEQLEIIASALKSDPEVASIPMSQDLREWIGPAHGNPRAA